MLRVDDYLYVPGCCWLCRSVNLPTVDTGMDLDGINDPNSPNPSAVTRFYICADCCIELARMVLDSRNLELVTHGSNAVLAAMVKQLSESNTELSAKVEELQNAMRVIKSIPEQPASSPAKKTFKVVTPPEEVEV